MENVWREGFGYGRPSTRNLSTTDTTTSRGSKLGGSQHPLLASGLASSQLLSDQLQDRHCKFTEQLRIWRGRRHHHRRRHYNINQKPSHFHATRLQPPSLHRQLSTNQHRFHLQMPRRRRKQGLLHQPETSPTLRRDITTIRSRSRTHFIKNTTLMRYMVAKEGKRKGVPQSQTAALPRHQEEEETDKSKQVQIEQTYEKH